MFDWIQIAITIGLGFLAYIYNRASRYNYLATRWNELMNINIDEPDFFNPEKTREYAAFSEEKKLKYSQHARMYWGFVEDIIRKDYLFERWWIESFVTAYRDTIADCIRLHHVWMSDNLNSLFNYYKFRKILRDRFQRELMQVSLKI